MRADKVKAFKKDFEKKLRHYIDENEKLRETVRSCDANLQTKCKHGRKNLSEYVPPKMK